MPIEIKQHVALLPYTMYKIGGPARFFAEPKNADEIKEAADFAVREKVPFVILGNGSNMLVSDKGFNGLVMRVNRGVAVAKGEYLYADAGVSMARAVTEAARAGLTGFEWGIGVPGTIGGSVRGNAGCFGGEMRQVVERVQLLEFPISKSQFPNNIPVYATSVAPPSHKAMAGRSEAMKVKKASAGKQIPNSKFQIREINNDTCQFNYRDSIFKKNPNWVILSTTLKLHKGIPEEIQEKIRHTTAERVRKQDIGTKSCGCIFKNVLWERNGINKAEVLNRFPELEQFKGVTGIPASYLVDKTGLKGTRAAHCFISECHANFFVNEGGATAADVRELIQIAKDKVYKKFGVELEEEIQYIGFED